MFKLYVPLVPIIEVCKVHVPSKIFPLDKLKFVELNVKFELKLIFLIPIISVTFTVIIKELLLSMISLFKLTLSIIGFLYL